MDSKNIVFVIESLHLGGAEKSLVTLINALANTHHQITLFLVVDGGIFRESIPNNIKVEIIDSINPSLFQRILYSVKRKIGKAHASQYFWKIFKRNYKPFTKNFDLAIAYSQGFATYYVDEKISAKKKYAWINTDYNAAGYKIDWDYKCYSNFNKIICVSSEAKNAFNSALSSIHKKLEIEVIKDITDKKKIIQLSDAFLVSTKKINAIKIVTVGRLANPKGFPLAINACKILVDKGYPIHWQIVGEGSERENLKRLIDNKNLQDHFELIGAFSNPYPYIKSADVYVQTSLYEGLGLSLIEASYLNKPIVTTNFPTANVILKHEETGLICEMNANAIADAIELLINDDGLRKKFISNLELQENKDKERTLKQIEELLNT